MSTLPALQFATRPAVLPAVPPGATLTAPVLNANTWSLDWANLSWAASADATHYEILRSLTNDVATAVVVGVTSGLSFEDFGSTPDIINYYWVRPCYLSPGHLAPTGAATNVTPRLPTTQATTVVTRFGARSTPALLTENFTEFSSGAFTGWTLIRVGSGTPSSLAQEDTGSGIMAAVITRVDDTFCQFRCDKVTLTAGVTYLAEFELNVFSGGTQTQMSRGAGSSIILPIINTTNTWVPFQLPFTAVSPGQFSFFVNNTNNVRKIRNLRIFQLNALAAGTWVAGDSRALVGGGFPHPYALQV